MTRSANRVVQLTAGAGRLFQGHSSLGPRRWLMGDLVPGPGAVGGRRFQATCLSPGQAVEWADRCGSRFAEQGWLASRLREAAAGWGGAAEPYAVVVLREAVGVSATDEEVQAVAGSVPEWLLSPEERQGEPGAAPDPAGG